MNAHKTIAAYESLAPEEKFDDEIELNVEYRATRGYIEDQVDLIFWPYHYGVGPFGNEVCI